MRVSKFRARKHSFRFSTLAVMISTVLAASLPDAHGATTSISAKAAKDKKTQKLVISGKTSGLAVNSLINAYDHNDHKLVYSGQTDAKSKFNFATKLDQMPCLLELQSGDIQTVVAVGGADKSCKAMPVCKIVGGDRSATTNAEVSFLPDFKVNKKNPLQVKWEFGDAASTIGDANSVSHTYTAHGLYSVTMTGTMTDKAGNQQQCSDAITVSVAPPFGTNPNAAVSEAAPRPDKAAGMPTANGGNDVDALVVFPYEEMGMEGGSQINVPFNALFPYNAMNAQIIQKVEHKPKILSSASVDVQYSAASNPKDPAKGASSIESINTTSQNLFSDGAGANFDPDTSTTSLTVYKDTTVEGVHNHGNDYVNALIAKTEFWDKPYQPNAKKIDPVKGVEKGLSQADAQNSIVAATPLPMIKPDQGIRGNSDLAAGVRAMPGISSPYKVNQPQNADYNSDQKAFVAQNIPLTPIDDQGRSNPYPLLRVEAKTKAGDQAVATDAVYTSASETGCVACHYKGEKGADDTVWRTPVTINELVNADGTPGPATGKGAFPLPEGFPASITLSDAEKANPVLAFKRPMDGSAPLPTPLPSTTPLPVTIPSLGYGPAIHQTFVGDKFVLDGKSLVAANITLNYDENGARTDRVAESRWLKPDGTTEKKQPCQGSKLEIADSVEIQGCQCLWRRYLAKSGKSRALEYHVDA